MLVLIARKMCSLLHDRGRGLFIAYPIRYTKLHIHSYKGTNTIGVAGVSSSLSVILSAWWTLLDLVYPDGEPDPPLLRLY